MLSRDTTQLATRVRRQHWIDNVRTICRFAVDRMAETQLQEVASSMTLTTLTSLVPIIAVSLAAFALFPSFEGARQSLEHMLFSGVLPQQYSETVVGYLRSFTEHASGLGIFGLAGLGVTALLLIDKFFVTVNRIFMVKRMRSWPQRALLYWALITLGPVFIAFSLTVTTQAFRSASEGMDPGAMSWLMPALQFLLQICVYTFLYKFVPNCHVPVSHAAIGGASAATAGLLVREVFGHYVSAGTLTSIYGAFVAFPVLLLWFYISWLIIFGGAAIAATIPLLTSGRFSDSYKEGNDFLTGVALLKVLWEHREKGESSVAMSQLCDEVDSYPQASRRILEKLAEKNYCGEITNGKHASSDSEWALLCDPTTTSLKEAFSVLLVDSSNHLVRPRQLSRRRDEGMLFNWHRELSHTDMLAQPLAVVFAVDEEAEKTVEKVEDKPEEQMPSA